jgi:hypothetical protein
VRVTALDGGLDGGRNLCVGALPRAEADERLTRRARKEAEQVRT